jgi:arylsulfatase A-like enzyme
MRPNFLIIQCDDLSPDDLHGESGFPVYTPHLDKLATQSISATDFTVHSVCSPSRATLLTGRHFLKTGVSHVHGGKDYLHLDETLLPERLREQGYNTVMWGKWHLGHSHGYQPWQRGFDEAYSAKLYKHRHSRGLLNGEPVQQDEWADTVITDYAIDFLSRHRNQPFFAYLPTLTPHTPHDAPESWVQFHKDRGASDTLAVNRAMISAFDEQIGRLLHALDDFNLSHNTLVLFMSDHGPAYAGSELSDADRALRNRSGRRGWKGDLYENGVQSMLFMRCPALFSARTETTPLSLSSLTATLLDLAGADPESVEGHSFAPLLLDQTPPPAEDVFNYAHRGWLTSGPPYSTQGIPDEYNPLPPGPFEDQCLSIRRGYHKLILNPDFADHGRSVLYSLSTDPHETRDLANAEPALHDRLLTALRNWWDSILREPHAFQPPRFPLQTGENHIPANAPAHVEGNPRNSVTTLRNWQHPGDLAQYHCHSPQAATATLQPKTTTPASWRISIPETGSSIDLHPDQPSPTLSLPQGPFRIQLELLSPGSLDLEAINIVVRRTPPL